MLTPMDPGSGREAQSTAQSQAPDSIFTSRYKDSWPLKKDATVTRACFSVGAEIIHIVGQP